MRLTLILLAVAACGTATMAQEVSDSAEFDTWTDFATIYRVNDRLRYDGDYGIRSWLTQRGLWQGYVRPSVRYRAKRWLMLHGGLAWFHTNLENETNINEIRPWVGLRLVGPRPGRFTFSNYFRLEYRVFDRGEGFDEKIWRGRYQLQLTTPRFKIGKADGFYALTFVEFFKEFGSSIDGLFLSQFRFDVGAGNQVAKGLRLELNYLFQQVEFKGTGFEPQDHILRVRMFYTFN